MPEIMEIIMKTILKTLLVTLTIFVFFGCDEKEEKSGFDTEKIKDAALIKMNDLKFWDSRECTLPIWRLGCCSGHQGADRCSLDYMVCEDGTISKRCKCNCK